MSKNAASEEAASYFRKQDTCVITSDEKGVIVAHNSAACRIFGYAQTMVEMDIKALMPSPFAEHHDMFLKNRLASGVSSGAFPISVAAKHASGSVFPVTIAVSSLKYPEGNSLFTAVITPLPPVRMGLVLSKDGLIQGVTSSFTDRFGWTDDEVQGKPVAQLIPPLVSSFSGRVSLFSPRSGGLRTILPTMRRKMSTGKERKNASEIHLVNVIGATSAKTNKDDVYVAELTQSGPSECLVLLERVTEEIILLTCQSQGTAPDSMALMIETASPSAGWALGIRSPADCQNVDLTTLIADSKMAVKARRALWRCEAWSGVSGLKKVTGEAVNLQFRVEIRFLEGEGNRVSVRLERHQPERRATKESVLPTLQHYKLTHVLGQGSFGTVFHAKHLLTMCPVAVKQLPRGAAHRDSFPREVELQSQLLHENVGMLHDIIKTPDCMYLVQEYIPGGDLHAKMSEPMPEMESAKYIADVLYGVRYLHQCNICHRDLKLDNLMIGHGGRIKIVDFGLAARVGPNGQVDGVCGTPLYAAPEVFHGRPYDGCAADMWSIGVCIFAMLTYSYPFGDEEDSVLGQYSWPLGIGSLEAKDLVAKLLEKAPHKRLMADQALSHSWFGKCDIRQKKDQNSRVVPDFAVVKGVLTLRNDILARMHSDFGFEPSMVIKSLQLRLLNQVSATYKLLLQHFESSSMLTTQVTRNNLFNNLALDKNKSKIEHTPTLTRVTFTSTDLCKPLKKLAALHMAGFALSGADLTIEEICGSKYEAELGCSRDDLLGVSFVNLLSANERKSIGDVKGFLDMMMASDLEFQMELVHRNGDKRLGLIKASIRNLVEDREHVVICMDFLTPKDRPEAKPEASLSGKIEELTTADAAPVWEFEDLDERTFAPQRCDLNVVETTLNTMHENGLRAVKANSMTSLLQSVDEMDSLATSLFSVLASVQMDILALGDSQPCKVNQAIKSVFKACNLTIQQPVVDPAWEVGCAQEVLESLLQNIVKAAQYYSQVERMDVTPLGQSKIVFKVIDNGALPLGKRSFRAHPQASCLWQAADNLASLLKTRLDVHEADGRVFWEVCI